MQWRRTLLGLTSVLFGLLLCSEVYDAMALTDEQQQPDTQTILDGIQELAELVVLEVQLTEVATGSVSGHTGGTTVTMLVRGSVAFAVDLEQARYVDMDQDSQRLVLMLPQPVVRHVAVSLGSSEVTSCQRSGLWKLAHGPACEDIAIREALDAGMTQIEAAAADIALSNRAKARVESVLHQYADKIAWSFEIRWQQ